MSTCRAIRFQVTGFTGWDYFASIFLSPQRMAKRIAKKTMKKGGPFENYDPNGKTDLVIEMPNGPYAVLDRKGNVTPYKGRLVRA